MPNGSKASTLDAIIKHLHALMTDSQEWWPAEYPCDDSKQMFVKDFVAAWNKVMNLDCYDLA
jgi:catalase (peroxidase I)